MAAQVQLIRAVVPQITDVGAAVQQLVTALPPDGYPDVHLVAEQCGMSARTLQRRLHAEGLTFARVAARARFDAALRLLDDPDRRVIDVALDLGYSDPAHFTRAFSRWTGFTPREFRRRRSTAREQPAPISRARSYAGRASPAGTSAAAAGATP